ncbi:MAG: RNA polymerase II mediator complex subunit [Pycnora praestabilis]|nr:MAG: RNA polymerase II mediator complex subunit [Pycnora praestabilis]
MGESLLLSLRPWPKEDPETQSLKYLIPRINQQRGGFRNITEDSLTEEIRALEAGEVSLEDGESENKAQEIQAGREAVVAARGDIVKQISQAQQEALYALDFVSLLLSKETPRQAEVSMSPYLREHVPTGSIGADRTPLPQLSEAEQRDREKVSQGWKLEGLNSAADSLLRSANRLEREMEQESRYWEQILAVQEKGWSVCRLSHEKHTLGVRFGFSEANPEFKSRGMAALRRAEGGNIFLDQGIISSRPKTVRVRIQNSGITTGTSTVKSTSTETPSTEDLILRARNTVYEEELYYEITREARSLANQGVRTVGSAIHLRIAEKQTIIIDLVTLDDDPGEVDNASPNTLAEAIIFSLRILLSYAHRENLERRSRTPKPINDRKPQRPLHAILRPVLTNLRHKNAVDSLNQFLDTFTSVLRTADLSSEHSPATSSVSIPSILTAESRKPLVETLIKAFTVPLKSSTILSIPSSTGAVTAVIEVCNGSGVEYHVSIPRTSTFTPSSMRFTSLLELQDYICYLTTSSLVSVIASYTPSATLSTSPSDISDHVRHGEEGWVADAQIGELTKTFQKTKSKRLLVDFGSAKMEMQWGWMNGKGEAKRYVWDGEGRDMDHDKGEAKRALRDVVREAGEDDS